MSPFECGSMASEFTANLDGYALSVNGFILSFPISVNGEFNYFSLSLSSCSFLFFSSFLFQLNCLDFNHIYKHTNLYAFNTLFAFTQFRPETKTIFDDFPTNFTSRLV